MGLNENGGMLTGMPPLLYGCSPTRLQSVTTCSGSTYLSGSTGRPFTCTS